MTCSVDSCTSPRLKRGMCSKHYQRWRKHGSTDAVQRIRGDDLARFWTKVDCTANCWLWQGWLVKGYGRFTVARRHWLAHRWLYEQVVGPVPEGLELDHLCRTRACVRPDHLEAVTASENVRRSRIAVR